jgi:sugar lactone lactonase YvrE
MCVAASFGAACHSSQPTERAPSAPSAIDAAGASAIDVAGFEQPESVLHDVEGDVYLVSNVAGSPFEHDGRGYISRVSPSGELLDKAWLTGLDAPKGMAIHGDVLAVADLTVVRLFDRRSGAARSVVPIEGAVFLNDVVAAPDGSFLVSDSAFRAEGEGIAAAGVDAIYRVTADGAVSRFADGRDLGLPNGLAFLGDELLVASFDATKLLRLGGDGARLGEEQLPASQLDGVVVLEDGCVLVASLEVGGVLRGRLGQAFTSFVDTLAMDIGYDAKRRRLLMPRMMDGAVRILPLSEQSPCD